MPIYPRRQGRRRALTQEAPIAVEPEIGTLDAPEFLGSPEPEVGSSPDRSGQRGPVEPMDPTPVQPDGPGGSKAAGSLEYEDLEADATGRAPAASDWGAEQAVRALRGAAGAGRGQTTRVPRARAEEESIE